ncbi:MAG: radical SAM protein [Pyrinomonadaceae bacterium]|nr:radical SAM protein [Pyrinomonadaceae bacterium]
MEKKDVFKAWGKILSGNYPSLSIEITRECPLRCPGCYAYEPEHLEQNVGSLRTLSDFKGEDLVEKVLALVQKYKPLHLSIVGGEPLVRFRELNILLPKLSKMGVSVQLVTSAVREIPKEWAAIKGLYIVVSIDGLQPEHDVRRKPATYQRILRNIEGHQITVHCTITSQTAQREGYYDEFLAFWSLRPEVKKVWFSLFTPQIGAENEEILMPKVKDKILGELAFLREKYPKLYLPDSVIKAFQKPPKSPDKCIFAKTTLNFTADLKNKITPCQFGGNPDCSQCGCFASAGLTAVGEYRLFNLLPLRKILSTSDRIGKAFGKFAETKEISSEELTTENSKVARLITKISRFRQF